MRSNKQKCGYCQKLDCVCSPGAKIAEALIVWPIMVLLAPIAIISYLIEIPFGAFLNSPTLEDSNANDPLMTSSRKSHRDTNLPF